MAGQNKPNRGKRRKIRDSGKERNWRKRGVEQRKTKKW